MTKSRWSVLHFHPSAADAWRKMPELVSRVSRFIEGHGSAAEVTPMCEALVQHFAVANPALFALGFVSDGRLVGHILSQVEDFYGTRQITVLQYEVDHGNPLPRRFREEALGELLKVARAAGATRILALCEDERVGRAHSIFHGFSRYCTVMTRPVTEAGEEGEDHGKRQR